MTRSRSKGGRRLVGGLLLAGIVAAATIGGGHASPVNAADAPSVGIVCTTSTDPTAGHASFDMSTTSGYINLPDGNTVFMYGYSIVGQPFQHPGPVLCVNEGDVVSITLSNPLTRDVSMMFPGQEGVTVDGTDAQPQFDGSGTLTSLTNVAAAGGGSVTYTFTASHPGTFVYESGTDPDLQVRLGLFGALIVRPSLGADYANDNPANRFTTTGNTATAHNTEEFLILLSEIDPYLNQAVEAGKTFNMNNYHPRYWLVNGRGFPDSIADNYAAWLPSQPYGALARVKEQTAGHPLPGLARYINVGTEDFPFHPHGNNGRVIAQDGQPLADGAQDLSYEKFSLDIGPGQTWDVLFEWYDAEHYSQANPVPVTVPQVANQVFGMFYSGSPYLGQTGPQPPGNQSLNQCGEFYIIAHNHALFQITSWGVNMTGPITYMRIDPADTTNCP